MTKSARSLSFRTQMVAIAAGAGMILGSTAVVAPTAMAKPPASPGTIDSSCQSPRGIHPLKNRGNQIITVEGENGPGIATGGSTITVKGYGFTDNQQDRPGFKINDHSPEDKDGEPFWPKQPSEYGTTISNDGRSLVSATDANMPNSKGEFALKFKLPETGEAQGQIGEGTNWVRSLSANPYFSHYALFLVVSDEVAQASKNTRIQLGEISQKDGKYVGKISGSGFSSGASVNLEYNCNSIGTVKADSNGSFEQAVQFPADFVEGRVDRQVIAREMAGQKLVKAAMAYNTQTPGGSVASVQIPEDQKVDVANGNSPTQDEINKIIALAKKAVPGGNTYEYNKSENRIEIFTAGNNQTRFYELSVFANVKSTSGPTPDPKPTDEPKPDPKPDDGQNGGSSPMIGIVVALLALLGLGGAAFAAWNWAKSQGLVR